MEADLEEHRELAKSRLAELEASNIENQKSLRLIEKLKADVYLSIHLFVWL